MTRQEDEDLIPAEEVASMLGMTVGWVYEQSRRGRIPTITLGRYRRYRRSAIKAWLESLEISSAGDGRPIGGPPARPA